jgi:hypothetical protein
MPERCPMEMTGSGRRPSGTLAYTDRNISILPLIVVEAAHIRVVCNGCRNATAEVCGRRDLPPPYNEDRPHMSLEGAPVPRKVDPPGNGKVVARAGVNGLHHPYVRRAA